MELMAIFPIPNTVCFPESTTPLHIFEPRYRKMAKDCIQKSLPMAVSLPESILSEGPMRQQSLAEALNSNQATFQPKSVFCGGPVRISQMLPDGRLMITVKTRTRYKLVKLQQELPYFVGQVEALQDQAPKDMQLNKALFKELWSLSEKVLGERINLLRSHIPDEIFASQDLSRISFYTLHWLTLEPEAAQWCLETTDPFARCETIIDRLQSHYELHSSITDNP